MLKKGHSTLEGSAIRQFDLYNKRPGGNSRGSVIKEENTPDGKSNINADVQVSSTDSLIRIRDVGSLEGERAAAFFAEGGASDQKQFEEKLKEATEEFKRLYESKSNHIKH